MSAQTFVIAAEFLCTLILGAAIGATIVLRLIMKGWL
jgi:hypothetical protein